MTELEQRWNREASRANYCGSEYHNDPERVFARVREMQQTRHRALLENVGLRREIAELEAEITRLRVASVR